MTGIHVQGFDHLVLRCTDVERTLAWYLDELGLAPVRVDEWRAGEVPFPSVRVDEGTIIDLVGGGGGVGGGAEGRNVDHLCLVVDAGSIEAALTPGRFTVVDGPDQRFGARGMATSVYVTDPDANVVELRAYP
jgi:catechol 2,3-dioxygenase-like lactoylglutathione lyase family enzyme